MQQRSSEKRGLLGSLRSGQKKLDGKTFYLDCVKKRPTALLLETISLFGGAVESFLHKDVSFVVTGSQEFLRDQKSPDTKMVPKTKSEETQHPTKSRENVLSNDNRRLGTPRPMATCSRGKALLEKAIRNNEQLQKNGVLANAQSWGVKILFVDDVLFYLKHLTRENLSAMNKKTERTKQAPPVVKAAALKSPYLKIEDLSRKYRPLHMQSMTVSPLYYSGRFSPFEAPPPPPPPHCLETQMEKGNKKREKKKVGSSAQDKPQTPLNCSPSPWRPRKKDLSYCECCCQPFTNLEEHVRSDQHRSFVLDISNYGVVDQLIAEMRPGFNLEPHQSEETTNQFPTPSPSQDGGELEPLTDAETEHAVQAMQRQVSSFTHVSSPTRDSREDPAPPPADTDSIPTLPRQNVEAHGDEQLPPCLSTDLYSLPPVLSPQVPHTAYVQDPHSSYSEPPVLSPQRSAADDMEDGHPFDVAGRVFESFVPAADLLTSTSRPPSNQELEIIRWRKSCSVPQLSVATPNTKKRFGAVGDERSRKKRRKISGKNGGTETGWSESPNPCVVSLSDDLLMVHPEISPACVAETPDLKQTFSTFGKTFTPNQTHCLCHDGGPVTHQPLAARSSNTNSFDPPPDLRRAVSSHSTSVVIECALIPDFLSPSSSDSDWDCDLLSRLAPNAPLLLQPAEENHKLDTELLHRPGAWMQNAAYESRLHTVLQPSTQAAVLCGEELEPSVFSRTVVPIVEVQH